MPEDVFAMVRRDLDAREAVGAETYGGPLLTHNGRDALWDAYEEALDLAMYLRQAIAERDEPRSHHPYDVAGHLPGDMSPRCSSCGQPHVRAVAEESDRAAAHPAAGNNRLAAILRDVEETEAKYPGMARELFGPELCNRLLAALQPAAAHPAEPSDMGAELGLTWRERIESTIREFGYSDDAGELAQAIADEFGVADNQWVTMRDPYTLPMQPAAAHPAEGTPEDGDLYEQLAAIEHDRWASWQRYLHSKCTVQITTDRDPGALVIPSGYVEHLWRLIDTPYAELTEAEKASDREQVDRYWRLIQPAAAQPAEGVPGDALAEVASEIADHLMKYQVTEAPERRYLAGRLRRAAAAHSSAAAPGPGREQELAALADEIESTAYEFAGDTTPEGITPLMGTWARRLRALAHGGDQDG